VSVSDLGIPPERAPAAGKTATENLVAVPEKRLGAWVVGPAAEAGSRTRA